MKRLLLTGAGGSIGCHTVAHVLEKTDWEIVGVDSFRHKGLTDRLGVVLSHNNDRKRFTLITHDLTAPFSELAIKKIGHIDYIISMASLSDVEASIKDPVPFIQNNVAVVLNTLELARAVKPQAFIQISTDEVYGPCDPEGAGHAEWSPIVPSNPYSASKAAQEAIAIAYWRSYGVPLIITNTMNNFGEMQQPSKYPAMLQKWITAGETVTIHGTEQNVGSRYYLHSRNHADALLFILQNLPPRKHQDGEIDRPDRYNIVGEQRLTNLELAQLIAKLMGKPLKYEFVDVHKSRPGHDRHYGLDGSKLAATDWKAPLGFKESLAQTIRWTEEHPEWL